MKKLVIGTRGSRLALKQTAIVKEKLKALGIDTTEKQVVTGGDKDQKSPLRLIGGNGLFVKEIEKELLDHEVDMIVHSGKDLPYEIMSGLVIAGTPESADPRDCLVKVKGTELGSHPVIGTGSPRRVAEFKRFFPEATFDEIRGNVDTRLRKLREGKYDAIILAKAGLDRLEASTSDLDVIPYEVEDCIPAPCQGILAVECRECDHEVRDILEQISHPDTVKRYITERKLFRALQADCKMAVGVHARVEGDEITIYGMFDGKRCTLSGSFKNVDSLVEEMKLMLL